MSSGTSRVRPNSDFFTTFDLEMQQPSQAIISIGAVVGNIHTGDIVEEFERFVQIDEPLDNFVSNLTGITDLQLQKEGVSLREAYEDFVGLHRKYSSFMNPVCWGNDRTALFDQVFPLIQPEEWVFGRRWVDVKTIYITHALANNMPTQGGLAKVLTRFGMQFQGRKHTAKDDAKNTFRLWHKLLSLAKR